MKKKNKQTIDREITIKKMQEVIEKFYAENRIEMTDLFKELIVLGKGKFKHK